ncbi:CoA-disulfide reductase [Evansella clarkii]|uniref:CoA-disulfide reductase n=1 Tax=Evansella clarkii TaxID=79879 RepID=UPI0009978590|nr:CoA-disulfide reductase [Evansella clarkii]
MKVVIIGGDAAGMSGAMQIVRNNKEAEIIVLEKGEYYSYAQCGLPYYIGGLIEDTDKLIARSRETFQEKYGIDARTLHEAQEINVEKQLVAGKNLDTGDRFEVPYDKLLIATGASPVIPPFKGRELEGVHFLKTIPDAEAIAKDMEEDVLNVTIIGGGYIGLEAAENFAARGKKVRVIDRGERIGRNIYDKEISEKIHEEAEKSNVELIFGETVEEMSGSKRVETIRTNNQEYRADMVVIATGVKPNTAFAEKAGINLHPSGAIIVNPYMETNVRNIYAAGDCATQYHRIKEKDDYLPLGTHANKQGRIAGSNIAGIPKTFKGVTGTSIIKFFDLSVGKTGLSEREAENLGIPCEPLSFTGRSHAGYYPESEPLIIKLLRHRETDMLLGVQVAGKKGVDKRTDVAATALYHRMTIADLENLDLSYAPPFNGVWDPLQQAARRY